ncbi:MAG: IMP dehydrogenase [Clostridia bacterium]
MENIKFDFEDINSRSECSASWYQDSKFLPLIAAPMDTVVSIDNIQTFIDNNIFVCIPRGQKLPNKYKSNACVFASFGISDMEEAILNMNDILSDHTNILIDIANGHMQRMINVVKEIKRIKPSCKLMVGNVANPETYKVLAEAGADYIRFSVGSGAGCSTSCNTGIHYPVASLIKEANDIRKEYNLHTYIIADGGMRNFSDIIKALALGADFVMCGSIFAKSIESCAPVYWKGYRIKSQKLIEFMWKHKFKLRKRYRGMSTKEVQKSWGNTKLKTSEGVIRYFNVEYTLSQWTENFTDYLKSAMSYTNSRTLEEFRNKSKFVFITQNALNRFKK